MRNDQLLWVQRRNATLVRWVPRCGLALIWLYYFSRTVKRARLGDLSDFNAFYAAAQAVVQGGDPYAPLAYVYYVYPPLLAWVMGPLTPLSASHAAIIWSAIMISVTLLAIVLASRAFAIRLGEEERSSALPAALLATFFVFWRLKSELQQFETNGLIILMFVLALVWIDRFPVLAGAALALAFNIKYLAITAIPYLLLRRRWSAAASFGLFAVALLFVPATTLGFDRNLTFVKTSLGGVAYSLGFDLGGPRVPVHEAGNMLSVSITSAAVRAAGGNRPVAMILTALAATAAVMWAAACYRRLGVPLLRWPRAPLQVKPPFDALVAVEWAGLLVMTLAFSPITSPRHLVLAVIPYMMFATLILSPRTTRRDRAVVILAAAIAFIGTLLFGPTFPNAMRGGWISVGGPSICLMIAYAMALPIGLRRAQEIRTAPSRADRSGAAAVIPPTAQPAGL